MRARPSTFIHLCHDIQQTRQSAARSRRQGRHHQLNTQVLRTALLRFRLAARGPARLLHRGTRRDVYSISTATTGMRKYERDVETSERSLALHLPNFFDTVLYYTTEILFKIKDSKGSVELFFSSFWGRRVADPPPLCQMDRPRESKWLFVFVVVWEP